MELKINWQLKKFEDLSPFELYKILDLRQQVFVVEQNCPYLDADGKDFMSFHLMGFRDNDFLAAYSRIVFPGVSYAEVSIGRVVNAPKFRRTGIGRLLMEESIKRVEAFYGNVPIRIGAQRYLLEFYKSFGFATLEDYMEDGIPHTIMLRK